MATKATQLSPQDQRVLSDVVDGYRQLLGGDDPRGREMLARLGIRSTETIGALGIGYSDGKIKDRVSAEQRRRLRAMGLLSHNNLEALGNALVFPARDPETDGVVDLLAIKGCQGRKVNFRDPPRGVINHHAVKADEIVVTDWIEASLMIHQAGWHAVIPVRGVDDLEANLLPRLKASSPRSVWLATVKRGTEMEAVLQRDLACDIYRLHLHRDYKRISADTLKSQMQSAERLQASRPRPVLMETRDDGGTYRHSGVRFRISGMANGSNGAGLRMVLTTSKDDREHTDRMDLLSASSRKRYAKDCERIVGTSAGEMETLLHDLIQEARERRDEIRRQRQGRNASLRPQPSGCQLSPDRHEQALEWLQAPGLLDRIQDDISTLGLVGERDNALLLYLVAVSRKLSRPLSAILRSESASGKSSLVDAVTELMPEQDVVYVSRLSGNALFYMPSESLQHRLLVVEERNGSEESDYAIRILQSKGSLTTAIPLPPEEPGVMRTRLITVRGPVAYVETSTADHIDPQNLNRCFEIRLDESQEQTQRVLAERRRRRSLSNEKSSRECLVRLHRDFQRLLEPLPVLIPFAEHLRFPSNQVRYRRDHERLLGLIDASTLLHQRQREIRVNPRGRRMVVATVDDYSIAYRLCSMVMGFAVDELSVNARRVWDVVVGLDGQPFTRRQLMETLDWRYGKTYAAINELLRHDLLCYEAAKGSAPRRYKALSDVPHKPEVGLLTPERLQDMLSTLSKDSR